jgi:hypothetical protein
MKQKLTSIPAHYRQLGDNEKIRAGDLYYCTLDKLQSISQLNKSSLCLGNNLNSISDWPEYKFFRRQHVPTKQCLDRVALNKSIEHWNRLATGTTKVGESTGMKDCALCKLHHSSGSCNNCPIKNFTGADYCHGSPYISARFDFSLKTKAFQAQAAKFRNWLKKLPLEAEEQ